MAVRVRHDAIALSGGLIEHGTHCPQLSTVLVSGTDAFMVGLVFLSQG